MKVLLASALCALCGCMAGRVSVKTSADTGWDVRFFSLFRDFRLGPVVAEYGTNHAHIVLSDYAGQVSSNGAPYVAALGDLLGNIAAAAMKSSPSNQSYRVTIEKNNDERMDDGTKGGDEK